MHLLTTYFTLTNTCILHFYCFIFINEPDGTSSIIVALALEVVSLAMFHLCPCIVLLLFFNPKRGKTWEKGQRESDILQGASISLNSRQYVARMHITGD